MPPALKASSSMRPRAWRWGWRWLCLSPRRGVTLTILALVTIHVLYNIVAFLEAGPSESMRSLLGWKPPPLPDLKAVVKSEVVYTPPSNDHRLLLLQSSDGDSTYSKMLDVTEQANLDYAKLWGFGYWRWDGIAWGKEKWLATFNRLYLLEELYRKQEYHWVLFLDPDAIIVNATKNAAGFLDDRYAMVAAYGGHEKARVYWDFNIGVAFFNLRHPRMGEILDKWISSVGFWQDFIASASSADYVKRKSKMPNDQSLLQGIIKWHPAKDTIVKVYRGANTRDFNYNGGGFIEHVIRATDMTPEQRLDNLKQQLATFRTSQEQVLTARRHDATFSDFRERRLLLHTSPLSPAIAQRNDGASALIPLVLFNGSSSTSMTSSLSPFSSSPSSASSLLSPIIGKLVVTGDDSQGNLTEMMVRHRAQIQELVLMSRHVEYQWSDSPRGVESFRVSPPVPWILVLTAGVFVSGDTLQEMNQQAWMQLLAFSSQACLDFVRSDAQAPGGVLRLGRVYYQVVDGEVPTLDGTSRHLRKGLDAAAVRLQQDFGIARPCDIYQVQN